jgi:hypothetical protein
MLLTTIHQIIRNSKDAGHFKTFSFYLLLIISRRAENATHFKRLFDMVTGNQKELRDYLKSEYGIDVTKQAISLLIKKKDYRVKFTPKGKIIIDESAKILSKEGFGKRARVVAIKKKALSKTKTSNQEKPIAPTPEEYQEDV